MFHSSFKNQVRL